MEEKRRWRIEQRWLKGLIIDSIRVKCKKISKHPVIRKYLLIRD
tara:strand:+ start:22505 stop:22636 length:132 start_codon:yes stop_codon:yes gene_type:complete